MTVTLHLEGPRGPGPGSVQGFAYFWLKYVRGFNPAVHCGGCLLGTYSKAVAAWKPSRGGKGPVHYPGEPLALDEAQADFYYLCGNTLNWPKNLHVVVRPSPGGLVRVPMLHDPRYTVVFTGAERLEIPPVPDGTRGLPKKHTSCRNWQFGMAYYPNATAER